MYNMQEISSSVNELMAKNALLDRHAEGYLPLAALQLLVVHREGVRAPNDPSFSRLQIPGYFEQLVERGLISEEAYKDVFESEAPDYHKIFDELVDKAAQADEESKDRTEQTLNGLREEIVEGTDSHGPEFQDTRLEFLQLLSERYLAAAKDYVGPEAQLTGATPAQMQAGNKWSHLQEVALMAVMLHKKLHEFAGLEPDESQPERVAVLAKEREALYYTWTFHDAQLMNIPRLYEKMALGKDDERSPMDVVGAALDQFLTQASEKIKSDAGVAYSRDELAKAVAYEIITDRNPKSKLHAELRKIDKKGMDALRTWIFKNNHYAIEFFAGVVDATANSSHHNAVNVLISRVPRNGLSDHIGMIADRLAATGDSITADEVLLCFWRYGRPGRSENGTDSLDSSLVGFMISEVFNQWLEAAKSRGIYRGAGPDQVFAKDIVWELKEILARADKVQRDKAGQEGVAFDRVSWTLDSVVGYEDRWRQLLLFTDLKDDRAAFVSLVNNLEILAGNPGATLGDYVRQQVKGRIVNIDGIQVNTWPELSPGYVGSLRATDGQLRDLAERGVRFKSTEPAEVALSL